MESKMNVGGLRVVGTLIAGNKIGPDLLTIAHICPYCFGSGKQKAMQMASNTVNGTVRTNDTVIECSVCKGKGFLK